MGLEFTFDGVPVTRQTRIKNFMASQIHDKTADDITDADVLEFIKTKFKKELRAFEQTEATAQAQTDFIDNYVDIF